MSAKHAIAESKKNKVSENLNGLLLFCKQHNTYFSVYVSKEKRQLLLILTDNPGCFKNINTEDLSGYFRLSRNDLNLSKLFLSYIDPRHLLYSYGQTLGIRFPLNNIIVKNLLDEKGKRFYMLEGPIKFLPDIIARLQELIEMKPQVKYEIIEKYIVSNS